LADPISLHRFILDFPSSGIDHRDLNGLNCTRSNLRLATQGQNIANQLARNPTGFKGVRTHYRRYKAQITVGGKWIHLGNFISAEEAARAYDQAARTYFGEFARVNFPVLLEPSAR
jgi:hypothetical protein